MYKLQDDTLTVDNEARQVWHTPTELFKPFYGRAVANYIAEVHKRDGKGPLVVYEVGAGNGTLMVNIMDHLSKHEPSMYETMTYTIIEISPALVHEQLSRTPAHKSRVRVINKSIFEWTERVTDHCFFVAMEVIDNFAHDMICVERETNTPLQGIVLTTPDTDFTQAFEPLSDPLLTRYLSIRKPQPQSFLKKIVSSLLPWQKSLSEPIYIPTMQLKFIDVLKTYFPSHRLVLSDFDSLPDAVEGTCGPVVQTRYEGRTVPVNTYLVHPGWFDIFFPTNFEELAAVYENVTGDSGRIMTQRKFLELYAGDEILKATTTKSGENPMLGFYENFKFYIT